MAGTKRLVLQSGRSICEQAPSRRLRPSRPVDAINVSRGHLQIAHEDLEDVLRHFAASPAAERRCRKRRCRTPSSMVSSRSSASSSLMAISASRVTWKGCASTISMPGNSASQIGRDHLLHPDDSDSSRRALRLLAGLRGRVSGTSCGRESGTLTRAKRSCPACVADQHRQVQAEIGDVRKGPARDRKPAGSAPGKWSREKYALAMSRPAGHSARRSSECECRLFGQGRHELPLQAIVRGID